MQILTRSLTVITKMAVKSCITVPYNTLFLNAADECGLSYIPLVRTLKCFFLFKGE
jgi:hypothetical protein